MIEGGAAAMDTDVHVDSIVETLREKPSAEQIEEALTVFNNGTPSHKEQLEVVVTLLKYTVPDVYRHLTAPTQDVVAEAFRSTIGLGNLLTKIEMLLRSKADLSLDLLSVLNCHTRLLERVLSPGLLRHLLVGRSALEHREVDRLLFRGKCLSILREADYKLNGVYIPTVCRDSSSYASYLCHELLSVHKDCETKLLNMLIHSLQGVSHDTAFQFFDTMFAPNNLSFLRTCVFDMKRFERKSILLKFIQFVQNAYLRKDIQDLVPAIFSLTHYCFDNTVWDSIMMESIISRSSYSVNTLAAHLAKRGLDDDNFISLVHKNFQVWGNAIHMKGEPIVVQGFRTHLLVSLCALVPKEILQTVLREKSFLDAISNRLQALSDRVRSLGVYLADKLCVFANQERIFNMEVSSLGVAFPEPITYFQQLSLKEAWDLLEAPTIEQPLPDVDELSQALKQSLRHDKDKAMNEADAQMSDEEDDPTLSTTAKVQSPLYIRDLLAYLSTDTKAPQAYEKIQSALISAPNLLRQKKAFGNEVAFYAEELLSRLAGMTNYFEDKNFETLRLNAMLAVVVSHPPVTTHLCHLLLTGDYSLQQRMCLLSAMSLAARELRGYRDEAVARSYSLQSFPTQMLPRNLHQHYLVAGGQKLEEYNDSAIQSEIQDMLIGETSENAKDELAGGRILRVSAGLQKKTKDSSQPLVAKDALIQFNKSVGKTFFFPLLAIWYQSGGINIGEYTPLLVAHYIKTLSLILHSAYPSAADLFDMAREFLMFLVSLLPTLGADQTQMLEGVCTGVLLVMEVVDSNILVTEMSADLAKVQAHFATIWENIIDERVKSLCAGLMLRLDELQHKFERTIMDQMNRGFI
ncbi:telomere binding protein [Candidozyma auris]|nr:hypothetical protein QG37_06255 [[Candida] auris]